MNRRLAIALGVIVTAVLVPFAVWMILDQRSGEAELSSNETALAPAKGPTPSREVRPPWVPPPRDEPPIESFDQTEPPPDEEAEHGVVGDVAVRVTWGKTAEPAVGIPVIATLYDGRVGLQELTEVRETTDAEGIAVFREVRRGHAAFRTVHAEATKIFVRAGRVNEVALRVGLGITVDGVVVDGDGRPVADAEVWMSDKWQTDRGAVVARTNARGRFIARGATARHHLAARARGFATSRLVRPEGPDGAVVSMRLVLDGRGTALTGTVIDSDGAPVAGAIVRVRREADAARRGPVRSRTDAEGNYELANVPDGEVEVVARARGFAPWRQVIRVGEGEVAELEIRLATEAVLTGRVLDDQLNPVVAARVRTVNLERFASSLTWTDAEGAFRLVGLPAESITIEAYQREAGRDTWSHTFEAAETAVREFELVRPPAIRGRLRSSLGEPLVGWRVVAHEDGDRGRHKASAPTDAEGRFSVVDLRNRRHVLVVGEPGRESSFPRFIEEDVWPDRGDLELIIPDREITTGGITGTVVDSEGAPIAIARVHVHHVDFDVWRVFDTRADGTFSIKSVLAGECEIGLESSRHAWTVFPRFRVHAGVTKRLGPLVLPDPTRIVGDLAAPHVEGSAPTVAFWLSSPDGLAIRGEFTREGDQFRSPYLLPGFYRLEIVGDGVMSEVREVLLEAGRTSTLHVVLREAAVRAFRVLPPGGAEPGILRVDVLDESGVRVWGHGYVLPVAGEFRFRASLPVGALRLRGTTTTGLRLGGTIEVAALDRDEAPVLFTLDAP